MIFKIEMKCPKCGGAQLQTEHKDYFCPACSTNFDGQQIIIIKLYDIEKRLAFVEENMNKYQ